MKGFCGKFRRIFFITTVLGTVYACLTFINNGGIAFDGFDVGSKNVTSMIPKNTTMTDTEEVKLNSKMAVFLKKTGAQTNNSSKTIKDESNTVRPSVVNVNSTLVKSHKQAENSSSLLGKRPSSAISPNTRAEILNRNILDNDRLNKEIQEARESIHRLLRSKELKSSTPVLLVTYMRSGSSWLGDITNQSKDSFYVYEPFQFFIEEGYYTTGLVCFYNDKCRQPLKSMESHHIMVKILLQIYACDIKNLHPSAKGNILRRMRYLCILKSEPEKERKAGFKSSLNKKLPNATQHGTSKTRYVSQPVCEKIISDVCKKAKFRVVKTIRFSMDLVQILMDFIPGLKVIHLVRDPRAITNSRTHSQGMKMSKETETHSIALCKEIYVDIQISDLLKQKYPKRITRIMYEALAERPMDGAKYIYKFLNIDFDKVVETWIYNSTHADKNNGFFGTRRSNSSAVSVKWRRESSFENIQLIQRYCKDVMNLLRYVPFKTEKDLRNFNLTARDGEGLPGFS